MSTAEAATLSMIEAGTYVGGAPLQLLTEAVRVSINTSRKFRSLLEDLEFTLACLDTPIYQQIIHMNTILNLPNETLVNLINVKVPEGTALVQQLSSLSLWNIRIWGNWCNCLEPNYAKKLSELNRNLKILMARLSAEEMMIPRLLLLNVAELQRDMDNDREQEDPRQALGTQQQVIPSAQVNGGEQVGGGGGRGGGEGGEAPAPALGASFGMLFDAVTHVKVKNKMCKRILTEFESTLDYLKPFIEEIAEFHKVLHLPKQEQEKFVTKMNKGIQLVHQCSRVRKRANYKSYQCSKDLLGLDESLQRLFLDLKGQVERKVKEAMVTVSKAEIKLSEESGALQNDQSETAGWSPVPQLPHSPPLEMDLQKHVQETSEGVEPCEGSDVVQDLIQEEAHLPGVRLHLLNVREAGDAVENIDSTKYTEIGVVGIEGIAVVDPPTGNVQGATHSVRNVGETGLMQIEVSDEPKNQTEIGVAETEPLQPTVQSQIYSGKLIEISDVFAPPEESSFTTRASVFPPSIFLHSDPERPKRGSVKKKIFSSILSSVQSVGHKLKQKSLDKSDAKLSSVQSVGHEVMLATSLDKSDENYQLSM